MARHAVIPLLAVLVAACAAETSTPDPKPEGLGGFPAATGGSGGDASCDVDGDGHDGLLCGGDDCDDAAPAVHPGADEACDAVDSDCDGDRTDGCGCLPGDAESCWPGEEGQRGVGACRDGVKRCGADGTWGACEGAVLASADGGCDGIDQDCDGRVDPPTCSGCAPGAVEICGNGLDDDCSGAIDEASLCTLDCSGVNPRTASAALACCDGSPPSVYAATCVEYPELLPACTSAERACLDLDGDPATQCTKECGASGCLCGVKNASGQIVASAGCGFLTPCARVACSGDDQPCYSGPPSTLGQGICHGGRHSCTGGAWTACEGEQLPGLEVCGNGVDDDCDGWVDEVDGATGRSCAVRDPCAPGAVELCGNGLDDDCDGFADEACPAPAGGAHACWTGELRHRGVGACRDGEQHEVSGAWSTCDGEVLPSAERCGDALDTDCDGRGGPGDVEDGACCEPRTEVCNGRDDDCDGLADEGLLSRCGTCAGGCFEEEPHELSDCGAPGRTCERITPVELYPAAITLDAGAPLPAGSDTMAFTEGGGKVVLMNTASKSTTSFTLPSPASRVMVSPDRSLWVATQAGTFLHLDVQGNLLCTAQPPIGLAPTVDSDGNLWVITGQLGAVELAKFSGKETTGSGGQKQCKQVDLTPTGGGNNLTITGTCPPSEDANHQLWVVGTQLQRVDIRSAAPQVDTFMLDTAVNFNQTMIGSDGMLYGNEWFTRIDLPPLDTAGKAKVYLDPWIFMPMYDGTAWVWIWPNTTPDSLALLDLHTGDELRRITLPDTGSNTGYGIALDSTGSLWTKFGTVLERFDLVSGEWQRFPRSGDVGLWPTSTDRPIRELQRRRARWTQVFDPGGYDVIWREASWQALVPSRGRVITTVRFADDPRDLDASPYVCGPTEESPLRLTGCSGGRRWARVELELSGYEAPAVDRLKLTWDRK